MRRFLKHIALFVPFALLLYGLLVYASGRLLPQPYLKNLVALPSRSSFFRERLHELPQHPNTDLLVVGPSVAHRSIDPRVFAEKGYQVFLLSFDGQRPAHTRILLERYLDSLRPKRVLYVVFPNAFAVDRPEATIEFAVNERIDGDVWREGLRGKDLRLANTLLYWSLRQAAGDAPRPLRYENAGDRYVPGGFQERRAPKARQNTGTDCWPGPGPQLNADQLRDLDACLSLLRNQRVPAVLLQVPLPSTMYRCFRYKREVDSVFHSRGTYLNFNGQVPLNDTLHFFDKDHLSPSGARLFSRALCDSLERSGFLEH